MHFGERIKALRKARGLGQQKVAHDLGMSQTMISSHENDEKFPREEILNQFAAYFGVSTGHFIGEAEETTTASLALYVESLRIYAPGSPKRFGAEVEAIEDVNDLDLLDSD